MGRGGYVWAGSAEGRRRDFLRGPLPESFGHHRRLLLVQNNIFVSIFNNLRKHFLNFEFLFSLGWWWGEKCRLWSGCWLACCRARYWRTPWSKTPGNPPAASRIPSSRWCPSSWFLPRFYWRASAGFSASDVSPNLKSRSWSRCPARFYWVPSGVWSARLFSCGLSTATLWRSRNMDYLGGAMAVLRNLNFQNFGKTSNFGF